MDSGEFRSLIEQVVTEAMASAGFMIRRTATGALAWRKDLAHAHLIIYFGTQQLYGRPDEGRWTVLLADDHPSGTARMKNQLRLLDALEAARRYEHAAGGDPSHGTPMPNTSQSGNA